MPHLVGQGTSGGSPALQGLYLYSSAGSGDAANGKDFEMFVSAAQTAFPFRLIRSEQGAGLRSR